MRKRNYTFAISLSLSRSHTLQKSTHLDFPQVKAVVVIRPDAKRCVRWILNKRGREPVEKERERERKWRECWRGVCLGENINGRKGGSICKNRKIREREMRERVKRQVRQRTSSSHLNR